jgi:ABC-type transport system involved in cytochrome bd biosynthesis fused ATPase/permease subunit
MRRSVARLKGLGFILWHTRHEVYHVLLGLVWAWFLREIWQQLNAEWIVIAVLGSLLPDLDHFFYFFIYGRKDMYSKQVKSFFKSREWRILWNFIETGHKYQTDLLTHNFYFMAFLFLVAAASFFYNWKVGVVLFGAMLIHYLFDVFDDIIALGYINTNWKRWRRKSNKSV